MGIIFEVQRRKADIGLQEPVSNCKHHPNKPKLIPAQTDPDHRVVGHLPEHRDLETDDEGSAMVGSPSERSPLLSRSKRQTTQNSLSSGANGKSHT